MLYMIHSLYFCRKQTNDEINQELYIITYTEMEIWYNRYEIDRYFLSKFLSTSYQQRTLF